MLGAIIGDIVGSRFERHNIKTKDFELFDIHCRPTDDSVMTMAVGNALMKSRGDESSLHANAVSELQAMGRSYPRAGYGRGFREWIFSKNPVPYNSYGNGSAMRVSACGWASEDLDECLRFAKTVTEVTHNHPEGIKGALCVTAAIFLARTGTVKSGIRDYIEETYYPMDFTMDAIRPTYSFDVSCQGSVPQAVMAFLESNGFEDAIRNAVSIGGDSDTLAAITGSIAEAYYGIPNPILKIALGYLDDVQLNVLRNCYSLSSISNHQIATLTNDTIEQSKKDAIL